MILKKIFIVALQSNRIKCRFVFCTILEYSNKGIFAK